MEIIVPMVASSIFERDLINGFLQEENVSNADSVFTTAKGVVNQDKFLIIDMQE